MDTTPAVATVNESVNGAVATVTESSGAVTTVTESSGVNGTLEAPSVAASTDNGNSKLIDDPMIADGPLISNEIIRNFKDKVTNVSDSMANKASDAVGKLKKTLNDGRGSINNENLNPFPPTTPDGRKVGGMNGLSNNIRNSMVNVSETMLNATAGNSGGGSGNSGENANASAESAGGLPRAANSSVNFARDTVLEEIGGLRNNSMNASNANGSRNPTKVFDGNRTNGSLSNGPHSNGSTYNASRGYFSSGELRNATMHSMANLTDQARSSLKARNAGSRFEAWRYWAVAVSVAVVSRL
ncbi:uncharacterized protein LOC113466487 [Diaphorina citri]|uniref:Uncharacterized protein LOC113466487 n=1 Tax=Diaphorina citri TaxID=121845 RepID=A0A3Q0INC8_DIACI|nr:uncharacterized protein LOC113466487 [Diaphorina citri]